MKKCASCSKDLPDAALHCVFCGAKQAPAPAQQPGLQKTVMGYSAQEMLAQMRAQGVQVPGAPTAPPPAAAPAPALFPAPAAAPYAPPVAAPAPVQAPIAVAPNPHAYAQPAGNFAPTMFDPNSAMAPPRGSIDGGGLPHAGSNAEGRRGSNDGVGLPHAGSNAEGRRGSTDATLPPQGFPQGFNPNAGAFNAPAPSGPRGSIDATLPPQGFPQGFNAATEAHAQAQALGMGPAAHPPDAHGHGHAAPAPGASTPLGAPVFGPSSGPIPAHLAPPVSAAPTPGYNPAYAAPASDPLGSLRTWSLVWGVLILVTFLLPIRLSPLTFEFLELGDVFGGGVQGILAVMMIPTVGLLAIVFGAIPMSTLARGIACALIGLASFGVALAFAEHIAWQQIVDLVAPILLLTGLILRSGYPGSLLARILVTLGSLATLALALIPLNGGGVPIVDKLTALGGMDTRHLVQTVLELLELVLAVAALLAWLPRTASGAAKPIYFMLLVLIAITPTVGMIIEMGGDVVQSPALLLGWSGTFATLGLATYGLGAMFGKLGE